MDTKICSGCGQPKPVSAFSKQWRTLASGTRKQYIKPVCSACNSRRWRRRHPEAAKAIIGRSKVAYHNALPDMLLDLYGGIGQDCCIDCGVTQDLEFDHRDPSDKKFTICDGFRHNKTFDKLLVEARKCDLRCTRCHTLRHRIDATRRNIVLLEDELAALLAASSARIASRGEDPAVVDTAQRASIASMSRARLRQLMEAVVAV